MKSLGAVLPVLTIGLAACSSLQTVDLPNGGTGYQIVCERLNVCEQHAQQICGTNYHVHEKVEHRPIEEKGESLSRSGASQLGGVTMATKMKQDMRPWWEIVVECNPDPAAAPLDDGSYARALAKNKAAAEENKRQYMAAVCALRDPELRRTELEIARKQYGEASCP